MLSSLALATVAGCATESRYTQDPEDVSEYQQIVTLVATAPVPAAGEPLVVDFPLLGSDVDEAISTATAQWGLAPVRVTFYGLGLAGRAGACRLAIIAGSGRVYPLGIAALAGEPSPVTRTAQVLPNTPVSTDGMTPSDASDVIAARAVIRATCEPLAVPEAGPTPFALTGGVQADRR